LRLSTNPLSRKRGFPAQWIEQALAYPGIRLLYLTPRMAIESTQLPGSFHRDPADQIIVALHGFGDARC
jgi:PIN domain nuclease of toxin-antitoxin system